MWYRLWIFCGIRFIVQYLGMQQNVLDAILVDIMVFAISWSHTRYSDKIFFCWLPGYLVYYDVYDFVHIGQLTLNAPCLTILAEIYVDVIE